jgi:hypothetical protein
MRLRVTKEQVKHRPPPRWPIFHLTSERNGLNDCGRESVVQRTDRNRRFLYTYHPHIKPLDSAQSARAAGSLSSSWRQPEMEPMPLKPVEKSSARRAEIEIDQ